MSESAEDRVHASSQYPNRAYCGSPQPKVQSKDWGRVTCQNCHAAKRADEAVRS